MCLIGARTLLRISRVRQRLQRRVPLAARHPVLQRSLLLRGGVRRGSLLLHGRVGLRLREVRLRPVCARVRQSGCGILHDGSRHSRMRQRDLLRDRLPDRLVLLRDDVGQCLCGVGAIGRCVRIDARVRRRTCRGLLHSAQRQPSVPIECLLRGGLQDRQCLLRSRLGRDLRGRSLHHGRVRLHPALRRSLRRRLLRGAWDPELPRPRVLHARLRAGHLLLRVGVGCHVREPREAIVHEGGVPRVSAASVRRSGRRGLLHPAPFAFVQRAEMLRDCLRGRSFVLRIALGHAVRGDCAGRVPRVRSARLRRSDDRLMLQSPRHSVLHAGNVLRAHLRKDDAGVLFDRVG